MNGAYPGHWRLASLGPISSAPVTVHIERLIERPTMPLCEEETQAHTNRFPVDGQGGVITVLRDRKNSGPNQFELLMTINKALAAALKHADPSITLSIKLAGPNGSSLLTPSPPNFTVTLSLIPLQLLDNANRSQANGTEQDNGAFIAA
ncbi:hypothetical protein ABVT39_017379 [Epinephelus coioides]